MLACRVALALLAVLFTGSGAWAGELVWALDEAFGEAGRGRNELREPVDVVLTRDGTVAVLDQDREAVVLFSASGRWLRTLGGTRGEGDLDLRRPAGLACDREDRLWVADSGNHRLVVADLGGRVLRTVGSLGSAAGRFRYPEDLVFDGRGRLFVADTGNERIQAFTEEGQFLDSWERRTGGRRDYLEAPAALAYTDRGSGGLWVLNRGWAKLERFERDGDWEESLSPPTSEDEGPRWVHVEVEPAFYRMFLSDAARGRVVVLDHRGRAMGEVSAAEASFAPRGLAVNRRMDIFVADSAGARVLKFKTR